MKIEKSYKVKKKNIIGVVEEAGITNWRIMVKTPSGMVEYLVGSDQMLIDDLLDVLKEMKKLMGTGAIQVEKDKEIVKEGLKIEYR